MSTQTVKEVLQAIDRENDLLFSKDLSLKNEWNHEDVMGVLRSLASDSVVTLQQVPSVEYLLTDEGTEYSKDSSPEAQVYSSIPSDGISPDNLKNLLGEGISKIGLQQCMKLKVLHIKDGKIFKLTDSYDDTTKKHLLAVAQSGGITDQNVMAELIKRRLVVEKKITLLKAAKGSNFSLNWSKKEADITSDMVVDGSWKALDFKAYNFNAKGAKIKSGHLNPLLKVRSEFRQIFLELGFQEMPTNKFVESSFWNFDALFQPQQHPARDAHDTFFLSSPSTTQDIPAEYFARVKEMHEKGGNGSVGWQYKFDDTEAHKNILRTHTTAISARMLYQLAQDGFQPKKYFSIDRVFRNESIDATHLAEFHQIEGLVADYNIGLVDLMGILSLFFEKLGIKNLKFKPAYNPYTEPSMEIFGYHPGLKKMIEVGNSGIFRPEMLEPMGLPAGVNVIAWGLSLERPTMIKYSISNIRSLMGNKTKLTNTYANPICMLDRHQ